MDELCDNFLHGRRGMIAAFVRVSDLARGAGVDEHTISAAHGQFFDGNVAAKDAFRVAILLARIWTPPGRRRPHQAVTLSAKISCIQLGGIMEERDNVEVSEVVNLAPDDPNLASAEGDGTDHEKLVGSELPGDDEDDVLIDAAIAEGEDDPAAANDPDPA